MLPPASSTDPDAQKQRTALAERLGIRLEPGTPDKFGPTLPPGDGFNEKWLEDRFGLAATNEPWPPDPLRIDRPRPRLIEPMPLFLRWQWEALRQRWLEEDGEGELANRLVVDPDIVDIQDLTRPSIGDAVHDLLVARKSWVTEREKEIRAKQAQGFGAVIKFVLPDLDLVKLRDDEKDGKAISEALQNFTSPSCPFGVCYNFMPWQAHQLVLPMKSGKMSSRFLTHVRKQQEVPLWKNEEKTLALIGGTGVGAFA